jgi:hypothetical protein
MEVMTGILKGEALSTRRPARSLKWCVLAAALLLAGCQSAPESRTMGRPSQQAAPADLQLICANAVVPRAAGARIRPTRSSQIDARRYSVDVDAGGRKFNCIIDTSGRVRSVRPA